MILPAWQKNHDAWTAAFSAAERAALDQWTKDAAQAKAAGQRPRPGRKPEHPEPLRPVFVGDAPGQPANLFNAMIHPLIPYGIRGAIWYQGESNAHGPETARQYAILFPAMITGWRRDWGIGDFPFLFVQLAGFAPGASWPELRDAQTQTLTLPDTGMAVTLDIGSEKNIHPPDKLDVGHRLALAARHVAYGENLVYSGPTYAGLKANGGEIRVSFPPRGRRTGHRRVARARSRCGADGSHRPSGGLRGRGGGQEIRAGDRPHRRRRGRGRRGGRAFAHGGPLWLEAVPGSQPVQPREPAGGAVQFGIHADLP